MDEYYKVLNKHQMRSLAKNKDYHTYVHDLTKKIYARPDTNHDPESSVHNYVLANSDTKHRMHIAITKHGKILNHRIYRRDGNDWHHLKSHSIDEAVTLNLGNKNKKNTDAFMDDWHKSTQEHPFNHRARIHGGTSVELSPFEGEIHLSDIMSHAPGKGHGTNTLNHLKSLADKHGVTLSGTAKAYSNRKEHITKTSQLTKWYKKHGFTTGLGNKDDGYDIKYKGKTMKESIHEKTYPDELDVSKKVEKDMNNLSRKMSHDEFKKWFHDSRKKERQKKKRELQMAEDAPTNAVGTGAIAGTGVGPQGEPGIDKKRKKIILATVRRKPVDEETVMESEKLKLWGAYDEGGHLMYTFHATNAKEARECASSYRKRSDWATSKIRLVQPGEAEYSLHKRSDLGNKVEHRSGRYK